MRTQHAVVMGVTCLALVAAGGDAVISASRPGERGGHR
jgi:hypothetical protein